MLGLEEAATKHMLAVPLGCRNLNSYLHDQHLVSEPSLKLYSYREAIFKGSRKGWVDG